MLIIVLPLATKLLHSWHAARTHAVDALEMCGLGTIVFGSIRWCVWSFRPSTPLALSQPLMFVCLCAYDTVPQSEGVLTLATFAKSQDELEQAMHSCGTQTHAIFVQLWVWAYGTFAMAFIEKHQNMQLAGPQDCVICWY